MGADGGAEGAGDGGEEGGKEGGGDRTGRCGVYGRWVGGGIVGDGVGRGVVGDGVGRSVGASVGGTSGAMRTEKVASTQLPHIHSRVHVREAEGGGWGGNR